MSKPTSASITEQSQIDFTALGYADANLDQLVEEALGTFSFYTGRNWVATTWEDTVVPEALAVQAVRKIAEVIAYQGSEDRAETFADFDLLVSFSAGSYNETRRSADDFLKLGVGWIWSTLGPLMTDEARDKFLENNGAALGIDPATIPAFAVSEVAWGSNPGPDSYDSPLFGTPGWGELGYGLSGNG